MVVSCGRATTHVIVSAHRFIHMGSGFSDRDHLTMVGKHIHGIDGIHKHDHIGVMLELLNALVELDLIESFVLDAQYHDGSEHRLSGFYTINEDSLKKLNGEQLELLNERGYLEAIYMAIASMTNLPLLLEKKNRLYKTQSEQVEH